jgi:hypothetical protein
MHQQMKNLNRERRPSFANPRRATVIKPIQVFGVGMLILVAGLISSAFLFAIPLVVLVGLLSVGIITVMISGAFWLYEKSRHRQEN